MSMAVRYKQRRKLLKRQSDDDPGVEQRRSRPSSYQDELGVGDKSDMEEPEACNTRIASSKIVGKPQKSCWFYLFTVRVTL